LAGKHIIFIHGRDTKPRFEEKNRLVRASLINGLRRIDPTCASNLEEGRVRFTLCYYGDITNRIMLKRDPSLKNRLVQYDGEWYEHDGHYDPALTRLFARPAERHTKADYEEPITTERNDRLFHELARVASPVLSLFGIEGLLLTKMFPDLKEYLTKQVVASEIRDRLEAVLKKALLAGDDIALIAHSMGTIVAYDVLWKFSRLSHYRELAENRVTLWLTLGSPLGDPAIRKSLIDAREAQENWYPANVSAWVNVSATDDFVAHDCDVKDDYREMLDRRLVRSIDDISGIHTFYTGRDGSNPHKVYGYLNHPAVARMVAAWMMSC